MASVSALRQRAERFFSAVELGDPPLAGRRAVRAAPTRQCRADARARAFLQADFRATRDVPDPPRCGRDNARDPRQARVARFRRPRIARPAPSIADRGRRGSRALARRALQASTQNRRRARTSTSSAALTPPISRSMFARRSRSTCRRSGSSGSIAKASSSSAWKRSSSSCAARSLPADWRAARRLSRSFHSACMRATSAAASSRPPCASSNSR